MASFELDGLLSMDASGYVSGAEDASDASEDLADSTDQTSESMLDLDARGVAAGAALVGFGTAAQSALDDTQALRETLGRTSVSMGLSSDETRELATEMSNATFPVDDVVGSMDALAQIGVESEAEMRRMAEAADLIADATGTSATAISENLAPAVRALDGDLSALEEDADAFTGAVRNSGLEMSDLASTIERLDFGKLEEMGLTAADTASIIGEFAEQSGFTGRQLRREFRSAVDEADGDVSAFGDQLNLSEKQMADLTSETSAGSDQTREFADAANESLSAADTLRSTFDDLKLATGDVLQPMSAAAPAIQSVGIAALTLSTINFSAVIPSIAGVVTAATPLLPILLPLGAALAGLGALWKKGWIDPVETVTWLAGEASDGIDWLSTKIDGAIDVVNRFYPPIRIAREVWERNVLGIQDTTEDALGALGDSIDFVIEKVNKIPGVNIGGDDVDVDEESVESTGETAGAAYGSGFDSGVEDTLGAASAGTGSSEAIDGPIEGEMTPAIRTALESGVPGFVSDPDEIEDASTEINEDLFDAVAASDAGATPETLGVSDAEFDALTQRFGSGSSGGSSGGGGGSSQSRSRSSGGSSTADVAAAVKEAIEGTALRLTGGTLSLDGDVATLEDVEAEFQRRGDRFGRLR